MRRHGRAPEAIDVEIQSGAHVEGLQRVVVGQLAARARARRAAGRGGGGGEGEREREGERAELCGRHGGRRETAAAARAPAPGARAPAPHRRARPSPRAERVRARRDAAPGPSTRGSPEVRKFK